MQPLSFLTNKSYVYIDKIKFSSLIQYFFFAVYVGTKFSESIKGVKIPAASRPTMSQHKTGHQNHGAGREGPGALPCRPGRMGMV